MKRLWKVLPPCLSDLMGFEAVMNETEGLGIIDDPSRYKPLRSGSESHERPVRVNRSDMTVTSDPGSGHHRGRDGHRDSVIPGMRVIHSDIRNEDIISGTHSKVMSAYEKGSAQLSPNFVLLAYGPSASMIGSDLEYAAEQISSQSGLPASYLNIDGEKDYLYGISCTLEAMGRLLLAPREIVPGTCNILGCNSVDWTEESIRSLEELLVHAGWRVLSRWEMHETTENLQNSAAASVNLVVNESGLRLARYMEQEYGIPYVAGAPFGLSNTKALLSKMRQAGSRQLSSSEARTDSISEAAYVYKTDEPNRPSALESHCSESLSGKDAEPLILIVGEQFTANAIRQELYRRGRNGIRVLSFYDMDKAYMLQGDKKLTGEDDFAAQANAETVHTVLADPDLQPLMQNKVRWIRLPNSGSLAPVEPVGFFPMVNDALDAWLNTVKL